MPNRDDKSFFDKTQELTFGGYAIPSRPDDPDNFDDPSCSACKSDKNTSAHEVLSLLLAQEICE